MDYLKVLFGLVDGYKVNGNDIVPPVRCGAFFFSILPYFLGIL